MLRALKFPRVSRLVLGSAMCAAAAGWPAATANARVAARPYGAPVRRATPVRPHPAVVRVAVTERDGMSYGSGTLIDVRREYGLVVTNWHVVRDAAGPIQVSFPDGFQSLARALKVDQQWDLAALVIWRPHCSPVSIADRAPRPGDVLTIAGYGRGTYRAATGRCTQYVAPGVRFPYEMVELSAEARQGDSGGPIFNRNGELAGVLFGAGHGTTVGAFCGRVGGFLTSLAPDIGASDGAVNTAVATGRAAPHAEPLVPQLAANPPRRTRAIAAGPQPRRPAAAALPGQQTAAKPADAWNDLAEHALLEWTKTILAAIGGLALLLALARRT